MEESVKSVIIASASNANVAFDRIELTPTCGSITWTAIFNGQGGVISSSQVEAISAQVNTVVSTNPISVGNLTFALLSVEVGSLSLAPTPFPTMGKKKKNKAKNKNKKDQAKNKNKKDKAKNKNKKKKERLSKKQDRNDKKKKGKDSKAKKVKDNKKEKKSHDTNKDDVLAKKAKKIEDSGHEKPKKTTKHKKTKKGGKNGTKKKSKSTAEAAKTTQSDVVYGSLGAGVVVAVFAAVTYRTRRKHSAEKFATDEVSNPDSSEPSSSEKNA